MTHLQRWKLCEKYYKKLQPHSLVPYVALFNNTGCLVFLLNGLRYNKYMILHEMNLQPKYYDFIKDGTKRIELRLYDEKRQKIKLGDEIEFSKSETEKFKAKVVGLIRYQSFEDLFKDFPIEILADKTMTKDELLGILSEFYTKEEQQEFGVIGIRIKLF